MKQSPSIKKASAKKNIGNNGKVWAEAKATNHNSGVVSAGASAGASAFKKGQHKAFNLKTNADAEFGMGGGIAEAGLDSAIYSYGDKQGGSVDVAKANVKGGLGIGAGGAKAKVNFGVDLVDAKAKIGKNQEIKANLGLNADTGAEVGVDGVNVSFLGLGGTIGRQTGIKTPFGSFQVKLW